MTGRAPSLALALLAAGLLGACGQSAPPAPAPVPAPADPDLVATYRGGEITAAQLDAYVLELPPTERVFADKDRLAFFRQAARELAVERHLLASAEAADLASRDDVAAALAEARRQIALAAFLDRRTEPMPPVAEEELRRRFDAQGDRFQLEAARGTLHLFQRRRAGESSDELRARMTELRERLVKGESFRQLASEYSESETRHRGGELGLLRPGQLPAALEEILFSLPVGIPSAPIITAEGAHLFQVQQAQEARIFTYDEVRSLLEREVRLERRGQRLRALIDELPPPPGEVFRMDETRIAERLAAGDLDAVVLRAGAIERTLGDLLQLFGQTTQTAPSAGALAELSHQLALRERVLAAATREGWFEQPEIARAWRQARASILVGRERQRQLEAALDRQPEELRRFYEDHRMRFASPLEVRLRLLQIPLDGLADANAAMARLETVAREGGEESLLDALASELGGTVTDLDRLPFPAFADALPAAPPLASALETGQLSPPIRTGSHLLLMRMQERREPAPRPFAAVIDEVRRSYLESQGQAFYRRWSERWLAEVEWRLFEGRLSDVAERAAGSARIAGDADPS